MTAIPPVPDNPFAFGGAFQLPDLSAVTEMPLQFLVQSAIAGTVDDHIAEHAEQLFRILDERGPGQWRETALLLIQYIVAGGHYQMGPEGAEQYLAAMPPPDDRLPALTAMHQATGAWIRAGRGAAARALDQAAPDAVSGAARYLFCVAVGGPRGVPQPAYQNMIDTLCAGVC